MEQSESDTGEQNVDAPSQAQLSEWYWRRLLEKLPAGAYVCDPDGLIIYFNQHARDLWGREPKLRDPVDRFCGSFRLFTTDGAPLAHDRCWMALALRNNAEYNGCDIVVERPDGRRVMVLAYANPVHDEHGHLLGAVNVLVDITDRKRAEEALEAADRAKNNFLATLAHELRNPLAPIQNAVEYLRTAAAVAPEARWAVDVIDRQARHLSRLVEDLVDVARITENKLELRKEDVDLAEVLNMAVETSRPVIAARGVELKTAIATHKVMLRGDTVRLAQAVSNLLNNAAQYTAPGGRIWLTADREGSDVRVSVRDTGVGIARESLPRIFDLFSRGPHRLDEDHKGLGVGLALAKQLVELHQGTIVAQSEGPGMGSEFVLRLPIVIEQPAQMPADAVRAQPASCAAPLRVLVVDDNHDSADSLGLLLQRVGHDVRTAYDGRQAVLTAEAFRPDAVLLDIGMPIMHGYDAARTIRQTAWGKHMLLIAMTGWGEEGDRDLSERAGFDRHLIKPLDPAALMRILASAARRDVQQPAV
jgi:signal transduction histidine kinase/ActR/RegA family two-component response regulator